MDRREFSVEVTRLLLGGAVVVVSGCGGGASPTAGDGPLGDAVGSVSENHGHTAVITAAQLGAGGNLELDIQGTSSHPHSVLLSASEVRSIRSGGRVEKESTGSRHTHTVIFNA